jgi:hypothetical protein
MDGEPTNIEAHRKRAHEKQPRLVCARLCGSIHDRFVGWSRHTEDLHGKMQFCVSEYRMMLVSELLWEYQWYINHVITLAKEAERLYTRFTQSACHQYTPEGSWCATHNIKDILYYIRQVLMDLCMHAIRLDHVFRGDELV